MSADNQQERLDEKWIIGFVDGEGCFHVGINKQQKMSLGFQILPEFRVVQHQRDKKILFEFKKYFGFGKICKNHDDRKEFRVRGIKNLNSIVKFFKTHTLKTTKQKNFELFSKVIEIMNKNEHLTKKGFERIIKISSTMNRKSRILRDYMPNTQ